MAGALWAAGFNIINGTLACCFDRLRSARFIPARFGERRALDIAAALHVATVLLLAAAGGLSARCGPVYGAGVLAVAALFAAGRLAACACALSRAKSMSRVIHALAAAVYLASSVGEFLL